MNSARVTTPSWLMSISDRMRCTSAGATWEGVRVRVRIRVWVWVWVRVRVRIRVWVGDQVTWCGHSRGEWRVGECVVVSGVSMRGQQWSHLLALAHLTEQLGVITR